MDEIKLIKEKVKFIKDYMGNKNPADSSEVDANANVSTKNIVTMQAEMVKKDIVFTNRALLHEKIEEMYGKKLADEYLKQLKEHIIYKHDESFLGAYTYGSSEAIVVHKDNKKILTSFEDLYMMCNQKEHILDKNKGVFAKYPDDLYIEDINGITKITRLVRKNRHRDMVRVKLQYGEDIIVTDNHPMIIDKENINDTVEAIDSLNKNQFKKDTICSKNFKYSVDVVSEFDYESYGNYCIRKDNDQKKNEGIKNNIKLSDKLGYFIGYFIAEGYRDDYTINIVQNNKDILKKLASFLFEETGITGKIYEDTSPSHSGRSNKYILSYASSFLQEFIGEYFEIKKYSNRICLPKNILETNKEFINGVICGLIDGDGTVSNSRINIRVASRKLISQLSILLRAFNFGVNNSYQEQKEIAFGSFSSNYPIFGINFGLTGDLDLNLSFKVNNNRDKITSKTRYKKEINKIIDIRTINNKKYLKEDIYDITTDSNHFLCNNIMVHNCLSVSMYPFLLNGLSSMGGESVAPKHLESYCGSLINFVYMIASQVAGACLYKDQRLIFRDKNNRITAPRIKDMVSTYNLQNKFKNIQGEWEFCDINSDIDVWENGKFTKVNRLFRRKYKNDIYELKTKSGKRLRVSEDHLIKVMFRDREIEVKAKDLLIGDTVFNTEFNSIPVDKKSNDYEMGQLIGIIAGDGNITCDKEVRVSINYKEKFISDRLDYLFNKYFKKIGKLHDGNRCYDYRLCSIDIVSKIREFFIGENFTSYNKHINVSDYSIDFLLGFLDGLLATDGSWSKTHVLSLANCYLINNVKHILEMININSDMKHKSNQRGNRKDIFQISCSSKINKYLDLTIIRRKDNITFKSEGRDETFYYGKYTWKRSTGMGQNLVCREMSSSKKNNYKQYNYDVIVEINKFNNDDEYVYEIETDSHWYSCGGILTHNCALPELFLYMDYFAKKDLGRDYIEYDDNIRRIKKYFEQIIYSLNQPAGTRNFQSIFWNVSIFDKGFFDSMFGNFLFPDGSKPEYESLFKLQKLFMNWFQKERERSLLTFPVITMAMVTKNGENEDKKFEDFVSECAMEGDDFFIYQGEATSLSSCCFDENTKIVTKSSNGVFCGTFKDLYFSKYDDNKKNLTILNNGSWCSGKVVKIDRKNKDIYRIITSNKKEIILTEDHINITLDGEKETKYLSNNDYLMFNNMELNTYSEKDMGLTYEQGVLIGAYLGDGSIYKKHINFSLNKQKYETLLPLFKKALNQWGIIDNIKLYNEYNNVYPVMIYSQKLIDKIKYWISGDYSYEKEINMDILLQSIEFRKGVIEGLYITDGGNSNRIYTTSYILKDNLEILINSIGKNSIIDISDRTDEKIIIRGEEYNRNYPLYCIRWYEHKNKKDMKDVYKIRNNSIYFKINHIKKIEGYNKQNVFCFEMKKEDDPYFTLANGVQTHNCRLKNDIDDNTFSHSLGAGGVATGSLSVMTLNLPRFVYNCNKNNKNIETELKKQLEKLHKWQNAYKHIIKDYIDNNMIPIYDSGYIQMDKQFLTIGINGVPEAYELSYNKQSGNNDEYKTWVKKIFDIITNENTLAREKYGHRFNTELVPAENVAVKFAKWDRESGINDRFDIYSSYYYKPDDDTINVSDKFLLHAELGKYCDGGQALHLNLNEQYLTKEQFKKHLEISAKLGLFYWTWNVPRTYCEKCGTITKRTVKSCPKCNSRTLKYATRIIGYLKFVDNFSEGRRKEENERIYHKIK